MDCALEEKTYIENGLPLRFITHIQYNKKNLSIQAHYHDYIEIIYAIDGENQVWLNDSHYTFKTGDVVLINSRDVHGFLCGDGSYLVLRFEPELLYGSLKSSFELKYILPFILNSFKHQSVFKSEEIKNSNIPQMLFEIYEEDAKKRYGYELAVCAKINEVFLWFLRYWHDHNIDIDLNLAAHENTVRRLNTVFDYVSENYGSEITAEGMAKLCNMSYSYFSRMFKKIMKKSFSEYLTYVRISEAEKLLITSDLNITEIAMQVGFSTTSYFIQQFKNIKLISPKQFRKNYEN